MHDRYYHLSGVVISLEFFFALLQGILQFQRISLLIFRFLPATRFLPAIAVVIEATFWCSISSCHCGVLIPASNSRNMYSDSPAFSRTTQSGGVRPFGLYRQIHQVPFLPRRPTREELQGDLHAHLEVLQ
ncbi:unnamed protein product [Urochloa humidicola]